MAEGRLPKIASKSTRKTEEKLDGRNKDNERKKPK
jgi:hypothetical protein